MLPRREVRLVRLLGSASRGARGLWDRSRAREVRLRLEDWIAREKPSDGPWILALDFSGTGPIDFSGADELVAKLLARVLGGEFGEAFFLVQRLTENHRENLQVALERKGLPLLDETRAGLSVLGTLLPYLEETLDRVSRAKGLTARELARALRLEMNTASTRLINLFQKRLVIRKEVENRKERGREFQYRALGPHIEAP